MTLTGEAGKTPDGHALVGSNGAGGVPMRLAGGAATLHGMDGMGPHGNATLSPGCAEGERVSCTLPGSRCRVIPGVAKEHPAAVARRARQPRGAGQDIPVQAGT